LRIPLKLVTAPSLQRYDCTGCGECCRGRFEIVITQEDRDRIESQGWTQDDLGISPKKLFTPHGDGFKLAHRADGSCIFLQDDNLCRIHAKHGEPAKPVACRLYPFQYVPLGNQVRVDIRFDCIATATNHGRPITEHRADLLKLLKDVVPESATKLAVPPLHGSGQLTWEQLARITESFERILLDVSIDITRRVAACVNLAAILRQPGVLDGQKLHDVMDAATSEVQQDAAEFPLVREAPKETGRMALRQLAGIYSRYDRVGEKAQMAWRLKTAITMLHGRGMVPRLRDDFPSVSFASLEESTGAPNGDAAAALERYLHVHLSGMGFFGLPFYNRSYLDGMDGLLLTYPMICWFARIFAVGEGLTTLNKECVERAIMIVDHQHGITPLLDIPTERSRMKFLCEPGMLRSLIAWYGS
jgi:lysine-N-methylase